LGKTGKAKFRINPPEADKTRKLSEKNAKNCKKFAKIRKNCKKLAKIAQNWCVLGSD
jgi:hypothetical protein